MYDESIREAICAQMEEGKSLREICRQEGMPSTSSVMRWLDADAAFREQYARARERMADALFEEVLEIADSPTQSDDRRVKIDARKWMVSKIAPKQYGDKIQNEHSGNVNITWPIPPPPIG